MDLSPEDSLRLNVLLHQNLQALRIDDSKMIVYGLSDKGEARIKLNPNCKDELYIRRIKELVSTHVLGSPGGYPIYLRRWTRMGQHRDTESLERLLKLGETEAVVAVVHAETITDEIARRAWWAMPDSHNARCLLKHQEVVEGQMGKILAEFLLEFLPFEEDPQAMIESVRLVLQPGLISTELQDDLWKKAGRKNAYLVGFLKAQPDNLPLAQSEHPDYQRYLQALQPILASNQSACQFLRVMSAHGQAWLDTLLTVMKKPANQDVVVAMCEAVEGYFRPVRPDNEPCLDMDTLDAKAQACCSNQENPEIQAILTHCPEARLQLEAMLGLSLIGEPAVRPIFSRTDAVGSVMRKKLEPVFIPMSNYLRTLKSTSAR